jgi:hypothetical protein
MTPMMAINWHVASLSNAGGLQRREHGDGVHVSYTIPQGDVNRDDGVFSSA